MLAVMTLAIGVSGLKAQDCRAIVLPMFNGDEARLDSYPVEKLEWRCKYARNALYVSDTVPAGAVVMSITEVRNRQTGEYMTNETSIDLTTISYYAYNFNEMQLQYPKCNVTICYSTPGAEHPYLVLRSIDETYFRTEFPEMYENK